MWCCFRSCLSCARNSELKKWRALLRHTLATRPAYPKLIRLTFFKDGRNHICVGEDAMPAPFKQITRKQFADLLSRFPFAAAALSPVNPGALAARAGTVATASAGDLAGALRGYEAAASLGTGGATVPAMRLRRGHSRVPAPRPDVLACLWRTRAHRTAVSRLAGGSRIESGFGRRAGDIVCSARDLAQRRATGTTRPQRQQVVISLLLHAIGALATVPGRERQRILSSRRLGPGHP